MWDHDTQDPSGFQPSLPILGWNRSLNPNVATTCRVCGRDIRMMPLKGDPFTISFKTCPNLLRIGQGREAPLLYVPENWQSLSCPPGDEENSRGPNPIPVPSCSAVVVPAHIPLHLPEVRGVMGISGGWIPRLLFNPIFIPRSRIGIKQGVCCVHPLVLCQEGGSNPTLPAPIKGREC